MSDYIIHNGTATIVSADEAYLVRTELEFEEVEERIDELVESDSLWVPNLLRIAQLIVKHHDTLVEALSDYRRWWDADDEQDAENYQRVTDAIEALELIANLK